MRRFAILALRIEHFLSRLIVLRFDGAVGARCKHDRLPCRRQG